MFAQIIGTLLILFALALPLQAQTIVSNPPIPTNISKWERIDWSDCITTTEVRFQSTLFIQQMPTANPKIATLKASISVFTADGKKFMESHTDYTMRPARITTFLFDDSAWRRYESTADEPLPPPLERVVAVATAKVLKTPVGKTMKDVACKDKPKS